MTGHPGALTRNMLYPILLALVLFASSCSLPSGAPAQTRTPAEVTGIPFTQASTAGQVRFVNLTGGGTIEGTWDDQGQPQVLVQVEASGTAVVETIELVANGVAIPAEARNGGRQDPFLGEITWNPLNGGGEYTLEACAVLEDKSELCQSAHVTVTGIPTFTPTPPPPGQAGAVAAISGLILQEYGVTIPQPTVYRFDDPVHPYLSRWIGSAYFDGMRYYVDLYDDGHAAWSSGIYSDAARPLDSDIWTICKPAGHYRLLILFVDYDGLLADPQQALDAIEPVVEWTNNRYADFALQQGLSTPPLSIEANAAFCGQPPTSGEVLTAQQVLELTGEDPADYDIVVEIDIDPQAVFGTREFPGVITASGGGIAMQGCARPPFGGAVHIWSAIPDPALVEGGLVMDINHELSHIFGLVDNWPIQSGTIPGPGGEPINDWIPYPMLGWTDTDGDGLIEITDPTPYGTGGPQP